MKQALIFISAVAMASLTPFIHAQPQSSLVPKIFIDNPDSNPSLHNMFGLDSTFVRLTPKKNLDLNCHLTVICRTTSSSGQRTEKKLGTFELKDPSDNYFPEMVFGMTFEACHSIEYSKFSIGHSYKALTYGFSEEQSMSYSEFLRGKDYLDSHVIATRTKFSTMPLDKPIELVSLDLQDESTGKTRTKYSIVATLTKLDGHSKPTR